MKIGLSQNQQWLLNLRCNIWWGIGYMHDLKVLTQNLLIICKRKNSNYLAEKVGEKKQKTFIGWSKLTLPRKGRWVLSTSGCDVLRKAHITFTVFWQGIYNPDLIIMKYEISTKWGPFHKTINLYFHKC